MLKATVYYVSDNPFKVSERQALKSPEATSMSSVTWRSLGTNPASTAARVAPTAQQR